MSINYDRLRELLDKAPPGPWEVKAEETSACGDLIEGLAAWIEADNERVFGCGMEIEEDEELTNLALAALAPDLARELLRLRDEIERTRDRVAGELERVGPELRAARVTLYAEREHVLDFCNRLLEGDAK